MAPGSKAAAALAIAFSMANVAMSQSYPDRPVRFVIGFPAGGGVDFVARLLAQKLSERWAQPAVVDNRPGASQIIATELVAKSKPDGLTVLIANAAHAISPSFRKLPYDTQADFETVSLLAQYPFLLMVHPALPARSVKDLIALAKARPGQLAFGSSGNGSAPHLGMELFKTMANVDLLHVPYKGAAPAITDLVSGEVQLMLLNLAPVKALMQSGRLRAFAVAGPKRSPNLPNVPSASESGLPGFNVYGWYGMLLPAGVPSAIKSKLHRDVVAALRADDVKQKLIAANNEVVGSTPQEFGDFLRTEMAKYASVIAKTGLKAK